MTLILGINSFHADSSAALVKDGVIICAAEEERFRRIKHWAGFPTQAITWCLSDAGYKLSDVNHIAVNSSPSANRFKKIIYTCLNRPSPRFLLDRWRNKRERTSLPKLFSRYFPGEPFAGKFHYIEHHRSHLSSAYYASSFEKALAVSVDGFGDFASSAWGLGVGSSLTLDGQVCFPHSLGVFYTALTQYLGFPNYGDEYKVMGLAPYGRPKYMDEMRTILKLLKDGQFQLNLKYFTHSNQRLPHQWSNGAPHVGIHYSSSLIELLGPARLSSEPLNQHHNDVASSIQAMYEEAFFHLLRHLHTIYSVDNLCIAGGCGANSVANGKISKYTPFSNVYVQAAAGDAGGALGSALDVWNSIYSKRSQSMTDAYLGCKPTRHEIDSLLEDPTIIQRLENDGCSFYSIGSKTLPDESSLINFVVDSIINGCVIGWFQDRMEWGPRALGHRSILGDPRRSDMKDILNLKIKRRESFRPFAPSVLQEFVADWFDIVEPGDVNVPYMMKVYPICQDKRLIIPAVTHVDGTGRLQTVNESDNGRYYRLINNFFIKTGVPMILNTSFNENEPIVSTPAQALDCFLRTKMDILVLDNVLITRTQ